MKILVAEDEPGILEVYQLMLETRGHSVTTASDGKECIEIYDKALSQMQPLSGQDGSGNDGDTHSQSDDLLPHQPLPPFDAVVLDYRMPKMDGLDAARYIIDKQPNQRIIFASAFSMGTLQESVKHLHRVVELLQKPFEMETLIEILEDKAVFEELKKINVNIEMLKEVNVTHDQLVGLLSGLKSLLKRNNPLLDCLQ